ncbi:MAG: outer membrane beta-barrel protein [Thiohalomonadales bacterium]
MGFDVSQAMLDLPQVSGSPLMIRGRFGMVLIPEGVIKFGFESHLAMGVMSDNTNATINGALAEVELEMETILGIYARAEFFNAGIFGLYGLLGYAAAQTGPALTALDSDSTTGISYGLGTTFFLNKTLTLQFEVLQVQSASSDNDFDVATINLGINISI